MGPRPASLPRSSPARLLSLRLRVSDASICPFCSLIPFAATARPRAVPKRASDSSRRWQSIAATSPSPRSELEAVLVELQNHSPNLVNLSRLQLALQGLRQTPGSEVVRIAILGLSTSTSAGETAKKLLKALLSDPLSEAEDWERELDEHDDGKPLIIRVAPDRNRDIDLRISKDDAIHELHVSSPALNALNIEILLMQVSAPFGMPGEVSIRSLEEAVLAPTVDIPSAEHRVSPVTTPVHQALLVADGLTGAINVAALPVCETNDSIRGAVQLQGISKEQLDATFDVIDVAKAERGIRIFRQSPQNAMEYERLWFASNVSDIMTWVKAGATSSEAATKPAVRRLVASLLQNTTSAIQAQEARKVSRTLTVGSDSGNLGDLNDRLATWAQEAHTELQNELDLAFTGRRWRKLGWWKLFWRVDDVAMLTNEMLSQRFMPTAEQELIYLTGRVAQCKAQLPEYPQPTSTEAGRASSLSVHQRVSRRTYAMPKWPGHIAFTRRYLQNETVPALQSLAQRLVLRSLGTSGLTTSLAALLYMSSWASTLYEAGAVAALGIVYSLGRMQKQWETARGFWEGEVREEGRKALRAAEESVSTVLDASGPGKTMEQEAEELNKARELVARAEDALARIR
ncbi:hypothetical protein HIM_06075 [Hirsutella minnesotensis 3608]|uniref:Mmc1 C-terminal domain-containing protein n=1 Tax=Hirsutella minnesotensis 3608 TaxID=1043627 RepID=A0A0F8A503_9HYPO|nr:hypothetical protein HIM_06075 [Hirsutella minnesotensis 3608]